jgi:putative hemolysin
MNVWNHKGLTMNAQNDGFRQLYPRRKKVRMMVFTILTMTLFGLAACTTQTAAPIPTTAAPETANLPNPASVYCEQQGNRLEIRTAADGSQSGVCIFPDGSECDEWAYYRGECSPVSQAAISPTQTAEIVTPQPVLTEIPTPRPVDPAAYQGWWTYTDEEYAFSILLPEDWVVEELTTFDELMNGHTLSLHPKDSAPDVSSGKENIRMAFRRVGEDARLWPTGVGQGEFIAQGSLDVGGEPAQRVLLVCPTGEVTSIWYHQADGQPNIGRGEMEFGFIFSATNTHCETGYSLGGKVQWVGEMIIASLTAP